MAAGRPRGRDAVLATGAALAATVLAGLGSVVVQAGSVAGYAVFALLAVAVLALLAAAGHWIRRARAHP
jgi:hypothetical protein